MAKTLAALIVSLCIAFSAAAAQSKPDAKKAAPKPAWTELSAAQQQVLAPLQSDWEQLDTTRRKKWVAIANRYPTMKPDEQQRLQKRMQEWAQLTPEERKAARARYQTLKKLPPQQRKEVREKWQEYQQSVAPPAPAPAAPAPETAPPGTNN
jgi:Skp family chaperone for outer membrane proteins